MTSLTLRQKSVLPLLLLLCIPAAWSSVSGNKVFALSAIGLFAGAAGVYCLRHPKVFFWGIVFTAPITDHLAINLGPFNVRPYNLLAAGGAVWFAW